MADSPPASDRASRVGERLELVLQRAERLAGRVGVGQHAPARGLELDDDPLDLGVEGRQRGCASGARTASCWASAATSRALPGSLPARTSASRRSTRSGGVSASASRSSRARSAACSSAASARAAAAAAGEPGAAARMPRSLRRAASSGSDAGARRGHAPPSPSARAALEALRRLLGQRAREHRVERRQPGTVGGGADRCAHSFCSADSSANTTRPVSA